MESECVGPFDPLESMPLGLASEGYAASIMIDGCSVSNRLDLLVAAVAVAVVAPPVWNHVTAAVWLSALGRVVCTRCPWSWPVDGWPSFSFFLSFFLSFFHSLFLSHRLLFPIPVCFWFRLRFGLVYFLMRFHGRRIISYGIWGNP